MLEVADEVAEWKEVPLVSLRALDRFFGKEPSEDYIRLPYRPASFGKKRRTFHKEERLLNTIEDYINNNEDDNQERPIPHAGLTLKPSSTVWIKPSSSKNALTGSQNQSHTAKRTIIKKIRKKKSSKAKGTIVKPKCSSNTLDSMPT